MSAAPLQRVAFGSSQERRLGNKMSRQEAPHLGPGCYDNHEFGTMLYDVRTTPGSKRGYSARTAARFPPCSKTDTPSPQTYQRDQSLSNVPPPSRTPFNSTMPRFKSKSCTAEHSPGPGSYAPNAATNRKVSWPMCFGRPDWSRLPQLETKALRVTECFEDKKTSPDFLSARGSTMKRSSRSTGAEWPTSVCTINSKADG